MGEHVEIPTGRAVAARVMQWLSEFEGASEYVTDDHLSELHEIAASALRSTATPDVVAEAAEAERDRLREALDRATEAIAGGVEHVYHGDCPWGDDTGARDTECAACQVLLSADAALGVSDER